MNKSLTFRALLAMLCLHAYAYAEIEFIYILKEEEYRQVGNVAPTTPTGWVFGAGVAGDEQISAATLTHGGPSSPVNLSDGEGNFEIDIQDYTAQSFLDTDYPNGDFSMNITDGGDAQNYGPFSVTGDAYPDPPHLLNPMALHSHDLSQSFTLKWAPFAGSDASDEMFVSIWDTQTDDELFFEFLAPSATSIVIPGGTLASNKHYEIGLTFINKTATHESLDTKIGYFASNYFELDTAPQGFEDPSVLVSRGVSANQTSTAIPSATHHGFLVEAEGAEFSSVTVIKPDASEVAVAPDGFAEFILEEDYNSEAERDAVYPEGNYSVRVVRNGEEVVLGPLAQSGATQPIVAGLTNYDAAQSIDPDQDFTLNWNSFSNAGDEAFIELEIWNINDQNNELDFNLPSDSQGVLLGSEFLQPNATYQGEIIFINPAIFPQTIEGIRVDSFFESFTQFTIQTGDGGGGGGGGEPSDVVFYRRQHQTQTAPGTLSNTDYRGWAFVNGNSNNVTSASLDSPTNTDPDLFNFSPNLFVYNLVLDTEELLNANFPPGDYSFTLNENGSPVTYGPYQLQALGFPEVPIFQNFNELSQFDATTSQSVNWGSVPSGVNGIAIELKDGSNNEVWQEVFRESLPSSVEIPSNTLQNNQVYTLFARFWNNQLEGIEDNARIGYLTQTSMTIETSADGGGNGNPPGVDFIYIIKERAYDQVANINPAGSTPEWGFGAGVSGGDNITAATVTYPGSNGPQVLPGVPGDYELDNDDEFNSQEALNAAYPNGQVSFNVTEDGSPTQLGPFNLTGDNYPEPPHIQNAVALGSFDFSQPFSVVWDEFGGGNAEDRIVFQLWRNDDDEELIFEFLDSDITSFELPANTLEPNKTYELDIIFVKETDGLETPDTIIGYLSTTRVDISTWPNFNVNNDLDIFMSKGTLGVQNSDQDPGVQQWFFFTEADVAGITSMSINLPDGTNFDIPISTEYLDLFEYEELFASQAELNAAFPDGNYHVTVTVNGVESTYGPYSLAGGSPPNQPYFTNFNNFQDADPSQDIVFNWTPFGSPPQDARVSLEIEGAPGYSDLEIDIPGIDASSTTGTLPANTLEPNSKYIASLFFEQPSTLAQDPSVFAGYETFVQTTFWTGSPTVGPNPATDLTAIIGNQTNVHLNWTDNSEDETGFRVERKFLWDEDWSAIGTTAVNATTFTDTNAALGEAYTYRVIAFDATDDGARSNEVEVQMQPPAEPTGLSVDPYNSSTLTLSWSDNSEGESGFGIDRSTDGNNWSNVGNTGPDENVFIDTGLESGSTFVYRVRALSGLGASDDSNTSSDTTYEATEGKPINISTRGTIGSGDDFIMIAGFVITGNENKDIFIRGIAPSLPISGETALLQDPELILFNSLKNQIDYNDNWKDHPRAADTIATLIPPQLDEESAIYTNLAPGSYTVQMRGADGGVGAGLVEVYEANPGNDAQLVNISTRGIAGTGDGLMIAGVIVKGTGNRTLYIRGNGPSLPASLTGRLTDTTLVMRDGAENIVAENDNWMDNENFASIVATTIPPGFPEEAAILVNVPATESGEKYTIELRGAGGEEGLAIIEVFEVPE